MCQLTSHINNVVWVFTWRRLVWAICWVVDQWRFVVSNRAVSCQRVVLAVVGRLSSWSSATVSWFVVMVVICFFCNNRQIVSVAADMTWGVCVGFHELSLDFAFEQCYDYELVLEIIENRFAFYYVNGRWNLVYKYIYIWLFRVICREYI